MVMDNYKDLIDNYKKIHKTRVYGNTSIKTLRFIVPHVKALQPKSIIDYGCGQSALIDNINLGYDLSRYRYDL
jgi:hypothetical protein